MNDAIYMVDLILIAFGIPFLIAINTWLLKQHLSLRISLKKLQIDYSAFKKMTYEHKTSILKEIEKLKEKEKN